MIQIIMFLIMIFSSLKADVVDLVLADSLIKQGNCEEAAVHYSRYMESSYNALAESNMAIALFCSGKKEEAFKRAYNAYVKDPANQIILYNLALIYTDKSDFSSSLSMLGQIDPKQLPADKTKNYYSIKCWDLFNLGNAEKAFEECKLIGEDLKKQAFNIQYRYARVLFALDDFKGANPLFAEAFKSSPGNDSAYYYALTLYRMGDKRTACNILENYLNDSSNKDLYVLIKGEIGNGGISK